MTILDKINEKKRISVDGRKAIVSCDDMVKKSLLSIENGVRYNHAKRSFRDALTEDGKEFGISVIAEIKKASPSKGIISHDFRYMEISRSYEQNGASCISCLTEEEYFAGNDKIFTDIVKETSLPVLRKDFIVDIYQVYESFLLGAECILVIMGSLSDDSVSKCCEAAKRLGMDVIFEVHDEDEVRRALSHDADIIGINNRNLKTFDVDIRTTERLSRLIPDDVLCISESGILGIEEIEFVKSHGADAVLVGETLMRSGDISSKMRELRSRRFGS